jgi:hypothetical protein
MSDAPNYEDAIAQLGEMFNGLKIHFDFIVDGEPFRITYREFLPVDVERKLQEVEKSLEDCDIAEVTLPNGKKIKGAVPAIPLRRNGELLPDSADAMRLIAMWGEEKYRRFEAAGCAPSMLSAVWAEQDSKVSEWRRSGSKSAVSG